MNIDHLLAIEKKIRPVGSRVAHRTGFYSSSRMGSALLVVPGVLILAALVDSVIFLKPFLVNKYGVRGQDEKLPEHGQAAAEIKRLTLLFPWKKPIKGVRKRFLWKKWNLMRVADYGAPPEGLKSPYHQVLPKEGVFVSKGKEIRE